MKPALTPEQWANSYTDDEGVCVDGRLWFAHGGPAESLHAIGAVCLAGKPFGFTREMVAMLREAADDPEMWSGRDKDKEILAVADLIAALLPPEK